jgi:HD-GYP domain-containing protein (c-di-GMP phosphodiesterase class II)
MDGLYIRHNNEFIDKVEKESEQLGLIARGDGTEVMIQKIQPGRIFCVSPGENSELMEFFYIVKGSVIHEHEEEIIPLKEGDYFYVHNIKETAYFKTETEVTLLYVSSRPVFYMLSEEMEELKGILDKIREKDKYTYIHDVRLQEFSMKIGEMLGLSRGRIENLLYAAAFHDIGKINVPDEILNKPGKLTPEEFEYIKRHPSEGRRILEETLIKGVGSIIEQHHERLDGSGYPYGLKGNDITMEARIIAVVDSFDAMTSDRPYRKAMPVDAAMQELKDLVGKHYDARVVKALEALVRQEIENDK